MKSIRGKITLLIFIFLLVVTYSKIENFNNKKSVNENTIVYLSDQAREIIASFIWLKIDYYHHTSDNHRLFNREILPLMKLTIMLDPHFVRAYSMLAFHLSTYYKKSKEAVKLLKKGIKLNSKSPILSELYGECGIIDFVKLHDTKEAELMFNRSIQTYTSSCDIDDFYVELLYFKYLMKKNNQVIPKHLLSLISKIKNSGIKTLTQGEALEKMIDNYVSSGEIKKDKTYYNMRVKLKYNDLYAPEESVEEHIKEHSHKFKCKDPDNCEICKHEFMIHIWHRHSFKNIKKRAYIMFVIALLFSITGFIYRKIF